MNAAGDVLRPFANHYLPLVISHLWSSTIFLLAILLVIYAMHRRLTAGSRFVLALIGILKFAVPAAVAVPAVRFVTDLIFGSQREPIQMPLQVVAGTFWLQPAATTSRWWPVVALTSWLAVALLLIFRFALTRHRLVTLTLRTALPPEPREVEALARARRRVGVRRSIDLVRSALPESPAVLRIFRPLIVLPAGGCENLSEAELESLLCHECAHVKRQDNLIARIESVVCALFWFHPLIWLAQRITVLERERACDEVVAGSAGERETYVAALTKFCHAAIAPRLPGVSCMATANLKERMDHVMNYATLRSHAPSSKRVTLLAAAALSLFTLAAAVVSSNVSASGTGAASEPYDIAISTTPAGESIILQARINEKATQKMIVAPAISLDAGRQATFDSSSQGLHIVFDVRPDSGEHLAVEIRIEKDGELVQRNRLRVAPGQRAATPNAFTGDPLDLKLDGADIRDVLATFGKITGLELQIDPSIQAKVSLSLDDVPWDQAFDLILRQNGLTYRIEGKTIHVSKK